MCSGTFESRIPMCLIAGGQDVAAHLVLLLSVSPRNAVPSEETTATACFLTAPPPSQIPLQPQRWSDGKGETSTGCNDGVATAPKISSTAHV